MFDPTAFENIRVVLEGIFYDKDLAGELIIIDRNDTINTAKLSRIYDVSFQLQPSEIINEPKITCKITIEAKLQNLSAELLPSLRTKNEAGCIFFSEFIFEHEKDEFFLKQIESILKETWKKVKIKQTVVYEPFKRGKKMEHHGFLEFNQLLTEDHMNDLPDIAQQIVETLMQMEVVLNRSNE
ncbi:hypothetical protein R4Z10_14535 [Niallia sp. XMNu-256]|uniref:hypothetical protein n=1 Tax=Niallia sp. XMNu-256 TaxID=3082444 RepID=UPI0030CEE056